VFRAVRPVYQSIRHLHVHRPIDEDQKFFFWQNFESWSNSFVEIFFWQFSFSSRDSCVVCFGPEFETDAKHNRNEMEMNASDQRSWYELAASRSAHQGSSLDAGSNHLLAATTSADEVDMFFPSLGDSTSNSRARQYYQQVHHAAQMHSAYNTAASHGKPFAYSKFKWATYLAEACATGKWRLLIMLFVR
jgi:hypothetical protein